MARRANGSSSTEIEDPEDIDSPIGIEVGTLAIQEKMESNKFVQTEIWRRDATLSSAAKYLTDGSTVLGFEILAAHLMPEINDKNFKVKRYVAYDLTVRQDSSIMDTHPSIIQRRYTDFRDLYTSLQKNYPSKMKDLTFPNKVLVGNFSPSLIAERSAAFETILCYISRERELRDSNAFLYFLQNYELTKACQLLDERRNELAIILLQNSFRLLNKIYMDRSKPVLLILCRLVAACTISPMPHQNADKWATLALSRYDTLCDIDLLPLYIPLLHTVAHLWWQRGRDQKPINDRLTQMSQQGIDINNGLSLMQAIHKLDPRTETC